MTASFRTTYTTHNENTPVAEWPAQHRIIPREASFLVGTLDIFVGMRHNAPTSGRCSPTFIRFSVKDHSGFLIILKW